MIRFRLNSIKLAFLAALLLLALLLLALALMVGGCAGFCPKYQANKTYIDTAQKSLHGADQVYELLVDAKAVDDNTAIATLALSGLDMAVPILKGLLDGVCQDDDKVNAAVFAVQAAQETAKALPVPVAPAVPTNP